MQGAHILALLGIARWAREFPLFLLDTHLCTERWRWSGGGRNEASHSFVCCLKFVSFPTIVRWEGNRLPPVTSLTSRVDSSTHRYPPHFAARHAHSHLGTLAPRQCPFKPVLSPRKLASLSVCFAFVHPSLHPDTGPGTQLSLWII